LKSESVKVPSATYAFWFLKLLTTGVGETSSDWLIKTINQYVAVVASLALFALLLVLQLRARHFRIQQYWITVTMVAVFGTQIADVAHIQFGIPYAISSAICFITTVGCFALWKYDVGTIALTSITRGKPELYYWTAICATFALGTALGDFTARTLKWGFTGSLAVYGVAFALAWLWWRTNTSQHVVGFWIAYCLTRPFGASFADWLAMPRKLGGLNIGLGSISLVWFATIGIALTWLSRRDQQSTFSAPPQLPIE
jgi:uncharacterized membrane-anchored protein